MVNSAQEYIDRFNNKERLAYLDLSEQELEGEVNLENFIKLTSINAYRNNFTNLNFLLTLPNKEKLKKLNFWGNKITNPGEALVLFDEFPNLESINLGGNPLDWDNLNNLEDRQVLLLINLIEEEKIKINSNSSEKTLLRYIKQLKEENITLRQQLNNFQQNQTSNEELIAQQLQQTHLPR